MNEQQKQAATKAMTSWLEHPQELGKRPTAIECVGEFDLYEMHYYIFTFLNSKNPFLENGFWVFVVVMKVTNCSIADMFSVRWRFTTLPMQKKRL